MRKTSFIFKTILLCLILSSVALSGAAAAEDAKLPAKGVVQKTQARGVPVEDSAGFANRVDVAVREKVLVAAQNSFDKSLGILSTVSTLMGVLVGLITIVIAVAAAFGFFEGRKWRRLRNEAEENSKLIKETLKEAEGYSQRLHNLASEASEKRSEVNKELPPSLSEKPSPEVMAKLDDLTRRQELLEVFGAKLTAEDYFARATDFIYKDKFELAIVALDKAIELMPNYAEAWSRKGWALRKLKRYDESLKASERAIEVKPDFAEGWYNKGTTLIFLKRYDESVKASERAIELKPDYAGAWFNRACCYSLKGEKLKALSDLKEAIRLDGKFKDDAKTDDDFKSLWDDEDFKKIVG